MKNTIYKYIFYEFLRYFSVSLFALAIIVWTIQSVNFLDLVIEDGHGFRTYFIYSIFALSKVITKLIPFCFMLSLILTLTKLEKDRSTIPSIRGPRYFGPSKMSFKNLIIHSLAIISVFKINVLVRSILFILVYMFLIHQNISAIMLIPIPLVVLLIVLVFSVSKRENLNELNNSLDNILNIHTTK